MTQPSPADELRAAAEVLRRHATAAETKRPGRWYPGAAGSVISPRQGGVDYVACHTISDGAEVARYIAVMDPNVGRALAQLLEAVGDDPDDETLQDPGSDRHDHCDRTMCAPAAALAVARAITGSQPKESQCPNPT